MMRALAAIFVRLVGLVLAAALVVAPMSMAFAACASEAAPAAAAASTPPCDMPCKDCAPKPAKKSCQGECVCVKTLFAPAPTRAPHVAVAFRPLPHRFAPPVVAARPPDPPPPRTILV